MRFFANRRNRIFDDRIHQMIELGKTEADYPDLFLEAALRYAQDQGGTLYPDAPDSIIFDREFAGLTYSVLFLRSRSGRGVNITLTRKNAAADQFVVDPLTRQANLASMYEPKSVADFPTWASVPELVGRYVKGACRHAMGKGLPLAFLEFASNHNDIIQAMMTDAFAVETAGGDFSEQQESAGDILTTFWSRLGAREQADFLLLN